MGNGNLSEDVEGALRRGDEDELMRLLSLDRSQVDLVDSAGTPLLHFAVMDGSQRLLSFLLLCNALVDARDSAGMTALHHAAKDGRLDFIEELVQRGASLELADHSEMTPLMWASVSRSGKTDEAADLLVRLGARMSLFPAVFLNRTDEVRKVLARNPIAAVDCKHKGDIIRAAKVYRNQEIIDLLAEHGVTDARLE